MLKVFFAMFFQKIGQVTIPSGWSSSNLTSAFSSYYLIVDDTKLLLYKKNPCDTTPAGGLHCRECKWPYSTSGSCHRSGWFPSVDRVVIPSLLPVPPWPVNMGRFDQKTESFLPKSTISTRFTVKWSFFLKHLNMIFSSKGPGLWTEIK